MADMDDFTLHLSWKDLLILGFCFDEAKWHDLEDIELAGGGQLKVTPNELRILNLKMKWAENKVLKG